MTYSLKQKGLTHTGGVYYFNPLLSILFQRLFSIRIAFMLREKIPAVDSYIVNRNKSF
jgi:hypothetical protein